MGQRREGEEEEEDHHGDEEGERLDGPPGGGGERQGERDDDEPESSEVTRLAREVSVTVRAPDGLWLFELSIGRRGAGARSRRVSDGVVGRATDPAEPVD